MKAKILNSIAFAMCLILVSCAASKITSFKDPDFANRVYNKIMVYVNTSDLERKLYIENRLVGDLRLMGVAAVEGYKIFPPTKSLSPSERAELMVNDSVDSYLSISVGDSGVEQIYIPPTGSKTTTKGTFSKLGSNIVYNSETTTKIQGGYNISKPWAEFETRLIDVSSGNTAWISKTFTGGNAFSSFNNVINSYCSETASKLRKDGLIKSIEDRRTDQIEAKYDTLRTYFYPAYNRRLVRLYFKNKTYLDVFLLGEKDAFYLVTNNTTPMTEVFRINKGMIEGIENRK